jgi:predicted hydrocarbon binding protein
MMTATAGTDLQIGTNALHQMRVVLERETGPKSSHLLREIGFAAGEAMSLRFEAMVRENYHVDSAGELDATYLGEALNRFFTETGWGSVNMSELVPQVMALDSPDWSEAHREGAQFPSCHFSCGALSDFFTRLGFARAAVMEVECRSRGEAQCRFLVGSPEMLTYVYERMASGMGYREAVISDQ